jgi:hypothetical protein
VLALSSIRRDLKRISIRTGFSLILERLGDEDVRKSVHMHINFVCFASILSELASTVRRIPRDDIVHRDQLAGLPLQAPFKSADTAITVVHLHRGNDFNGNLLDETRKLAALTVLPGLSHHQERFIFRGPGDDDPDAGLDSIQSGCQLSEAR